MTLLSEAFAADANAQLVPGSTQTEAVTQSSSVAKSMAPAASIGYSSMVARDASGAAYSRSFGAAWDQATTTLTGTSVLSSTATKMSVLATVEDVFHIAGTPNDGSLQDESIMVTPYVVDLSAASDGSWQVTSLAEQLPNDPSVTTGRSGLIMGPTASTTRLATASRALRAARRRVPEAHIASAYNANAAYGYMWTYWGGHNPAYPFYGNDCQNFVSQILYAGGEPLLGDNVWSSGEYDWYNTVGFQNLSWALNGVSYQYLGSIYNLVKGDVAQFGWHGDSTPDHAMAVNSLVNGVPWMTGHTNPDWNLPITTILADNPNTNVWAIHPTA